MYIEFINAGATEYFCFTCGQLRLSLNDDKTRCGNCGSVDLETGSVGELDKETLKREYEEHIK